MSFRVKLLILIAFLVAIPLFVTSTVMFNQSEKEVIAGTLDRLEAIADVQKRKVNDVIQTYLNKVRLIASIRTIAYELDRYNESGEEEALQNIKTVLQQSRNALPTVRKIEVYGLDYVLAVSTENDVETGDHDLGLHSVNEKEFAFNEIFKNESGELLVRFIGPITIDKKHVGMIEVVFTADPFIAITEDYTGLGKTGEVVIGKESQSGDVIFVTPLRYDVGAALTRGIPKERTEVPITSAVANVETVFVNNTVDYRGVPVIAVTRHIDVLGWGIVVKIDRDEALLIVNNLFKVFVGVVLVAIVVSAIMAYFFSKTLTRPIRLLTIFAENLQAGNLAMRTEVTGKDEIGLLAKAFNSMAAQIEETNKNLEAKVEERTHELAMAKKESDKKLQETERLNKVMIDRELKMKEMKQELEKLRKQ